MGMRFQIPVHVHVRQRWPGGGSGRIHDVLFKNLSVEEEYPRPSRIAGFAAGHDVRGVRFENYTIAGRVRLSAVDANVEIGPFVSDVTFAGPSKVP